ncbi:hypothetical protein NDU88_000137 [Pleurodeles waltl]|uniref:Uncharacterized protein n=1 Tax=Pleurodeles waltl TaxID=8319 RepID=A0AAV7NAI4_PLEWA|nr:hypothetical protein NDU88_000137 [Pleurodeles waltl]
MTQKGRQGLEKCERDREKTCTKPQTEGKPSQPKPERTQDLPWRGREHVNRRWRDEENNRSRTQELRGRDILTAEQPRHIPGGTWLHNVRRYFKEGRSFLKRGEGRKRETVKGN